MVLLLAGNKYFTLYFVGDLDPLPESFSSVILRQHESGGIYIYSQMVSSALWGT